MTPPTIVALYTAAEEAAKVHAEKTAAFEDERGAAVQLLALAVTAVLSAFDAIAIRQRFFGPEAALVVLVATAAEATECRKLYVTPNGGFAEARYAFRAGSWAIVEFTSPTYNDVAGRYEVEALVASMTNLCAGVASGNAPKRALEARRRAKRLRAFALILESVVGASK